MSHVIVLKSWATMGVPNTEASCSCGEKAHFWPSASVKAGHRDDYDAARKWRCPKEES